MQKPSSSILPGKSKPDNHNSFFGKDKADYMPVSLQFRTLWDDAARNHSIFLSGPQQKHDTSPEVYQALNPCF
jgi:hypothetical protein